MGKVSSYSLLGVVVCLLGGVDHVGAGTRRSSRIETARVALRRAEPTELRWKHSQRLDVNCDRIADEVFTATDEFRFYVAVVLGPVAPKAQYSIAAFGLAGQYQDSFCGRFESLTPEPLTTGMAEATGEEPLGYRASSTCKGLRLVAGQCDPFHLFWNHMSNSLDWWRL